MTLRSLDRYRFFPIFAPVDGNGGGAPATSSPTPSSSSTPASAPASTPSGGASTATPGTPAGGGLKDAPPDTEGLGSPSDPFDYDKFFAGEGPEVGSEAPVAPPPAQPESQPTPPQPPAGAEPPKPAEAAAAVPPVPAQPAAPPSPSAPPSTEGTPSPAALDPTDPGSILRSMISNEKPFLDELTKSFALSQEEIEGLETDIVGTVPKLLAKVYYQANIAALQHFQRVVPAMVQRQTTAVERNATAENEFYTKFPDLKPDTSVNFAGKQTTVRNLTRQYAALFRRQHPQASKEEMFEFIGPMVMMASKVKPGTGVAAPGQQTPPAPAARIPGFVPAPSGGASQPSQVELNVVEAMMSHADAQ